MVSITIKGLKDGCHIYAFYDDFQAFIKELQQRLQEWNLKGTKEVFFHLAHHTMEEILNIIQICNAHQLYISGWNPHPSSPSIKVIEGNLRDGECYYFDEDLILFGNIEAGSEVLAKGNLYIMGSMNGNVDLFYRDCVLYAGKIDGNIRICDSLYHNVTSFAPTKIYYHNAVLQIDKVKEEHRWAKRLR